MKGVICLDFTEYMDMSKQAVKQEVVKKDRAGLDARKDTQTKSEKSKEMAERNATSNGDDQYKLKCVTSKHRQQIDAWLNENKPYKFISEELQKMGDYISVASISKYAKSREAILMQDLQATPEFQAKQMMITEEFNKSVAKIQKVDLIGRLSEVIEDSAELLADAKNRNIRINNVKDMRMIQQTMLDAVKIYGETMLNAQKYQEIQNDPSLLGHKSTTININVRDTLTTILKEVMEDGSNGYELIDRLRTGVNNSNR